MKGNYYQTTVVTPANEFLVTRFPTIVLIEYSKNGKLILPQNRFFITKGEGAIISDKEFQNICGDLANLILERVYKNGKAV